MRKQILINALTLCLAALLLARPGPRTPPAEAQDSTTTARKIRETSGPTTLAVGAVSDGQFLKRVGSTVVGASAGGVGGSTGSTDNAVLRADGAGGATLQNSAVTVDDAGRVTGAGIFQVGGVRTTFAGQGIGLGTDPNSGYNVIQSAGSLILDTGGSAESVFIGRGSPIVFASSTGGGGERSRIYSGSGSPEGAVAAPVGSLYLRTDGGGATSFYVKESGVGNTGWVAK